MLSVIIETHDDEERLARTLSTLVSAAVEGVVREVIVCDRGSVDQTWRVADQAGCRFLKNTAAADAMGSAKADWILLLEPGARLLPGWTEMVIQHVAISEKPATLTPFWRGGNWLTRLFRPRRPLACGLLIPKMRKDVKKAQDAPSIARRVKGRRIPAGIVPAGGMG